MVKRLTFLASFPPIQSAIKRGQDGMRIQLDIPESEMHNAAMLIGMTSAVLRITIEVDSRYGKNGVKAKPELSGDFSMDIEQS